MDHREVASDSDEHPSKASIDSPMPLMWIYAALESGAMINFPGNGEYPEDYDPRPRPWYRDSTRDREHHWRPPYADLSGRTIQMPCTQAIFDTEGAFVGLVGIDIALPDLRPRLRMDGSLGWSESWIVDGEGRVLVGSAPSVRQVIYEAGDRGLDLPELPARGVRTAIRRSDNGGVMREGKTMYVHVPLPTLNWHLVAAFDGEQ